MAIGLALVGPVGLDNLRDWLPPQAWRDDIPLDIGATVVPSLARGLLQRGHRVLIVSYAIGLQQEVILDAGPLRICLGPGRQRGRARDFFAAERHYLTAALTREQPALIHAHWSYEFALAAQATARATGRPCLVTAHDAPLTVLRHDPSPYRFMRTLMAFKALRQAGPVIAVSPHIAAALRRWPGFHGQVTVIPNGLDDALFRLARPEQPDCPEQSACPVVFASVLNGWGRLKNTATLLRAFARLRQTLPHSRLLLIGAGHGPDGPAAHWAMAHDVATGVDFIGSLPHADLLTRLRQAADILVHPSLEESQGMAIVEAMACGLPVIGGHDSGAVPWVLDHGRAGLLADMRSPDALAAAMQALALAPERRRHLAQAAAIYAEQQFSSSSITTRHEALYAELAGNAWRQ